jgi:Universal stress protein family
MTAQSKDGGHCGRERESLSSAALRYSCSLLWKFQQGLEHWMVGSYSRLPKRSLRKAWSGSRPWASRQRPGWASARLGIGEAGREIAKVAEDIGANLVVVGHRPDGPLARWWFGSVGTYLVKNLHCSVLIAQTEIGDDEFSQLLTGFAVEA